MFFGNNITPNKQECCGCSACEQICTYRALKIIPDNEGFLYPVLDPQKCTDCNLCEKVCPMLHGDDVKSEPSDAYAAVNKDINQLLGSSSGGIFSVIATHILELGGIVYGASFDDTMQLQHIGISQIDDLEQLRGSKYLQSNNKNVYSEIKESLKKGKWIYYTGTGCQVAGLKCFLRKKYPTLLTSDLICHGTPSQIIFDAMIAEVEKKYNGKIIKFKFRDKKINGWSCSSSSCYIKNKNKIKYLGFDPIMKAYFNAFIAGDMNREACYNCPFTTVNRAGDITLADYWGISKYHTIENKQNGISAILINTKQGEQIIHSLENQIKLVPTKIDWIADENHNLTSKTRRPAKRNTFYTLLQKSPSKLLQSYKKDVFMSYIRFNIKKICRKNDRTYSFILKIKDKIKK